LRGTGESTLTFVFSDVR